MYIIELPQSTTISVDTIWYGIRHVIQRHDNQEFLPNLMLYSNYISIISFPTAEEGLVRLTLVIKCIGIVCVYTYNAIIISFYNIQWTNNTSRADDHVRRTLLLYFRCEKLHLYLKNKKCFVFFNVYVGIYNIKNCL